MAAPKRNFKRRPATRSQKKRVLIVCEGEKTEPYYFEEMVRDLRIHGKVKVTGDCGSAPISVVDAAIDMFSRDGGYDEVFCVFDRDGHVSFSQAVDKVSSGFLRKKIDGVMVNGSISAITSTPCFEYWILLHYSKSSSPMNRYSDVVPYLRRIPELAGYQKGSRSLYGVLRGLTDVAIRNSEAACLAAEVGGFDNPVTKVHLLINRLRLISAA